MEIGVLIKFWRETRNYTEAYMAAELGISQSAYSKLEKGKIKIDADRLFKISMILKVSLDELSPHKDNLHNQANGHKTNDIKAVDSQPNLLGARERELYKELITEKDKLIIEKQETISILKEMLSYFKFAKTVRKTIGKKVIQ